MSFVPGRRTESRNPIQVGAMLFLGAVAVAQMALGPEGSRVLLSMAFWSQKLFSVVLLAGSALTLVSTVMAGWRGRVCEVVGLLGCSVSLFAYAMSVADITAAWITNPAVAFAGIGLGCAARAGLLVGRR